MHSDVLVRRLGVRDYAETWRAMQEFSARRTASTPDEFWLVEHLPVFTMGLKGHAGVCREIAQIPVVYSDRGGDMTYHGPGQPIVYVLLDIARARLGVRSLVQRLEQGVIEMLAAHEIMAERRAGAPGVYVADRKIASLGLRVRRGVTYHGLAFNYDMDLGPFAAIDPCGIKGLRVTQFVDEVPRNATKPDRQRIEGELAASLARCLGYNSPMDVVS